MKRKTDKQTEVSDFFHNDQDDEIAQRARQMDDEPVSTDTPGSEVDENISDLHAGFDSEGVYRDEFGFPVRQRKYCPGLVVGELTLLKHEPQGNSVYLRGFWRAKCSCNNEFLVHTRDLNNAIRHHDWRGSRCPACYAKLTDGRNRTRPPAPHAGKTVGRLVIDEWIPGRGWRCVCTRCEQLVFVRTSAGLGPEGLKDCSGECGGAAILPPVSAA
jgi:hypothetical protein